MYVPGVDRENRRASRRQALSAHVSCAPGPTVDMSLILRGSVAHLSKILATLRRPLKLDLVSVVLASKLTNVMEHFTLKTKNPGRLDRAKSLFMTED